jgi:hypothetical protein
MVNQSAHAGESVRVPVWRAVLRVCSPADGRRLSARPPGPASIDRARVATPPSVLELLQSRQQHEGAPLFPSRVSCQSADGLAEPKTIVSPVTADSILIAKTAAEFQRPSSPSSESRGGDRPIIAHKNSRALWLSEMKVRPDERPNTHRPARCRRDLTNSAVRLTDNAARFRVEHDPYP